MKILVWSFSVGLVLSVLLAASGHGSLGAQAILATVTAIPFAIQLFTTGAK